MRILLSTQNFGGAGGIQRHVAATLRALGDRHEIDVCARIVEPGEYGVRPTRGRIVPRIRWAVPHRVPRRLHPGWQAVQRALPGWPEPYDIYLHYQYGDWLRGVSGAPFAVAIPCGAPLPPEQEAELDAVLLEAPDNVKYVADPTRTVLLPPPLARPAEHVEPVPDLPDAFFLTVFNSHSAGKGLADLRSAARRSPVPFVWCRSTLWEHPDPASLPGVVVQVDRSQAQLRFLYERCRAYVSFDHDPGFGWSLADALLYGAPAISRGRGVMTLPGLDTTATWTYDSEDELVDLLHRTDFAHTARDLEELSPRRFVERFDALLAHGDSG